MKALFKAAIGVAVCVIAGWTYLRYFDTPASPVVSQALVVRGDVVESVTAIGVLAPTRTVEIGSQVSGQVAHVYVDYNSLVKRGEVLARMDASVFEQHLDSAKASVAGAKLILDEHELSMAGDQNNLARTQELFERGLVSETDREAAELQVKEDQAQVAQDRSVINVDDAQVQQAQVDVDHCTITSPIDGVVIERDVDDGQAVAAGVQAPKLFVLASNLNQLQLMGDIDEANVAKLAPGQTATFTIEDLPHETFHAVLSSVRLAATDTNAVITYKGVFDVTNADLRLRPSMSAQITMQVRRESNVLRVPNAALNFRPTYEVFEAFSQPPPEAVRVSDMTSTIETPGQIYVLDNGRLKRVMLTLGITDGMWTAVESGDLKADELVVTGVTLPGAKTGGPAAGNPLAPRVNGGRSNGR